MKYIYYIKNIANMLFWKMLIKIGFKRSKDPIPNGLCCYSPDFEKNKNRKEEGVYYIKPCKYYKSLWSGYNGCSYLGIITDDMVFDDQCKMCGEKES